MPSSSKRCFTGGEARTCTIVVLSFAMISFGVFFGTHSPYQSETKKPGRPALSAVGISGEDFSRVLLVTANGLALPAASIERKLDDGSIMKSIWPESRSCIRDV